MSTSGHCSSLNASRTVNRMNIAVYGASGYTGKLVAAELRRRGLDMVLAGRSIERLREAAGEAGVPAAELRAADLDDPTALAGALRGCDVVINCVAPFIRLGEPVVRAAIAAGCHYVDIAGEQRYIKRIFDAYAGDARRAGVTVIPGLTDDGLTGDLIAHLVAERIQPVERLTIAHRLVSGGPSRGTMRSALQNLDTFETGGLTYEDGAWRSGERPTRTSITFPESSEPSPVVQFPAPEVVTIPRHVRARRVEGVTDEGLVAAFRAVTPQLVEAMPGEGPPEERRRAARFTIVADAAGGGRCVRGVVQGVDMYGTTAVTAIEGARRLVASGAAAGVLAPAQAYDAAGFLDFLAPHGVSWTIEDLMISPWATRGTTAES